MTASSTTLRRDECCQQATTNDSNNKAGYQPVPAAVPPTRAISCPYLGVESVPSPCCHASDDVSMGNEPNRLPGSARAVVPPAA
ncbi:uncharacterized protein SPSK_04739 [Sporothrix schenckii 1099-18]|uniref:Uncharacterized protein n=1 Tax=Sporothrix schenckii 1099-18 TaxID=1397361 RepID=A0A0F2M1E1_SPOSC|nr:uncharacterized protein SPSK_04739 [Sporothrix schenckii 1099-18]KJR83522.1 hypothetical protein SPSK_04739 [Sporothrix schenckii 1099-18]